LMLKSVLSILASTIFRRADASSGFSGLTS
jgi:hypothetical protein